MKLKHFIAWVIYFSILASVILLMSGCEETELDRSIRAWQVKYPDRTGDCGIIAMQTQARLKRKGVNVRFCHGNWKDEKHCWCEYEKDGKWLIDDKSIGNKGYERWEYKTGNKPDYELTWYGE